MSKFLLLLSLLLVIASIYLLVFKSAEIPKEVSRAELIDAVSTTTLIGEAEKTTTTTIVAEQPPPEHLGPVCLKDEDCGAPKVYKVCKAEYDPMGILEVMLPTSLK